MPEPVPEATPEAQRRGGLLSFLRRFLLVILLLEGLYLLGGNLFLRPTVGPPLFNRKPEKLELRWAGGWTVVPGILHLRGLKIDARAGKGSWGLELDRSRAVVALLDLPRKCFRISRLEGHGLRFWAELPENKDGAAVSRADETPAPGSSATESSATESSATESSAAESSAAESSAAEPSAAGSSGPPRRAKSRKPWRIRLERVAVAGVRELTMDPYRYQGDGTLQGDLDLELRGGPLVVSGAALRLEPGALEVAGGEAGTRIDSLDLEMRLDTSRREERRGRRIFRFLTGRLRLEAADTQLAPLGFLLRRVPSMDLEGQGSLAMDLAVDHGRMLEGSTLTASGFSEVRYLDSLISGGGTISGEVVDKEGVDEGHLTISFDRFEVRQSDLPQGEQAEPHVFGTGAQIRLASQALDLAATFDEGGAPAVDAVVEIPSSEVPHLETYNRFLPPEAGVKILQGRGTLNGTFFLKAPEGQWSGSMALAAENLSMKMNDLTFTGNVQIDAVLPDGNIRERRAGLSGTRIRIEGARFSKASATGKRSSKRHGGDLWWARLELPEGEVALTLPIALQTSFRATMRDTSPFLSLVMKDRTSPQWLSEALTVEGIAATGEIFFRPRHIDARELAFVAGDHIELQGHLRFSKPSLSALLFCRYRKLSTAVLLQDGRRDWDLVGSRNWFHRQEAAWLAEETP